MFLNYIKNLSTKKKVKNKLSNVSNITNNNLIKKVGIIFDETYFHDKEALIRELVERGILEKDIEILIFRDIIKKNQTFDWPSCSSWLHCSSLLACEKIRFTNASCSTDTAARTSGSSLGLDCPGMPKARVRPWTNPVASRSTALAMPASVARWNS